MADTKAQANNVKTEPGKGGDKLNAAKRNALSKKDFAGPDRSYPVEDREHAANAKARATEMYRRGSINDAEYKKIIDKANAVLADKPAD